MTAHGPHPGHGPAGTHDPHASQGPAGTQGPHAGHGPAGTHDPHHAAQPAELPAELAAVLAEIVPPGGAFRHREHIHLAYLAVRRHGADRAAEKVSGWIRHMVAYQRAPQKFNATVTTAWIT